MGLITLPSRPVSYDVNEYCLNTAIPTKTKWVVKQVNIRKPEATAALNSQKIKYSGERKDENKNCEIAKNILIRQKTH